MIPFHLRRIPMSRGKDPGKRNLCRRIFPRQRVSANAAHKQPTLWHARAHSTRSPKSCLPVRRSKRNRRCAAVTVCRRGPSGTDLSLFLGILEPCPLRHGCPLSSRNGSSTVCLSHSVRRRGAPSSSQYWVLHNPFGIAALLNDFHPEDIGKNGKGLLKTAAFV